MHEINDRAKVLVKDSWKVIFIRIIDLKSVLDGEAIAFLTIMASSRLVMRMECRCGQNLIFSSIYQYLNILYSYVYMCTFACIIYPLKQLFHHFNFCYIIPLQLSNNQFITSNLTSYINTSTLKQSFHQFNSCFILPL